MMLVAMWIVLRDVMFGSRPDPVAEHYESVRRMLGS